MKTTTTIFSENKYHFQNQQKTITKIVQSLVRKSEVALTNSKDVGQRLGRLKIVKTARTVSALLPLTF